MAYFTNEFKGVDYFEDIDFHHLEFYVGNAKQSKEFYKKILDSSNMHIQVLKLV